MGRLSEFARFFRDDRDDRDAALVETARLALEWCACGYHKRFTEWLDKEASKPFAVSADHMGMVQQAVRSNTFREIRAYLSRIENEARSAIDTAREA